MKLVYCGTLAIMAFGATSWVRLGVTAALLMPLTGALRCGPRSLLSKLWPMRWLLLFTLLLHLLLSPGYTLFGIEWLSRDGLLRGLMVCTQLSVAVLAAALLTTTSSAEEIALASGWLLSPLSRLGCPVRHWQELTVLVLKFFPAMREELQATTVSGSGRWTARIRAWEEQLLPLFDRLVDRADQMARRVAAGDEAILPERPVPPLAWHAWDILLFIAVVMGGVLYFAAPR